MAESEQEEISDCEYPASTAAEPETDSRNLDEWGRGSKYRDARKSNTKRHELGNLSHDPKASNNNDSRTSSHVSEGPFAQSRARVVLIVSVSSVASSLAGFVVSLRISESTVGVVASVLECVIAVGIFCVGLYGTLKEDPSFLALYSVFGVCMALAQALWIVLGSYSIHQLNATLRVIKDEEQVAAIKSILRSMNVYVAAAALGLVGYALAALTSHRLKMFYQQNFGTPNMQNRKSKPLKMKQSEVESSRHATVAVASPFA